MSFTFDPYKLGLRDVSEADDVLMTNPTALSELEEIWSNLPRDRGVPKRMDVDPAAMSGLLEDSFILERVAPGVARIRVAGRNIAQLIGVEPRGLPITAAFLPESRAAMAGFLEAAFTGPSIVELSLDSPRAVGQPVLKGKLLLLPLRDDQGEVTRILGALVMSGRRGVGNRRFNISHSLPARVQDVVSLKSIEGGKPDTLRPSLRTVDSAETREAKAYPALRLVVSNP